MIKKEELLTQILQTKHKIISEEEEPRSICEEEMNNLAKNIDKEYDIRDQLVEFISEMEKILKENDYKGGWDSCSIKFIRDKLIEEFREVLLETRKVINEKTDEKTVEKTQKEAIDLANMCMILYDKLKTQYKGR